MTDIINGVENNNKVSSDSSNERKRRTKKELFQKERDEIIENLNKLLGLNKEKNSLFYYELEHNEKAKEYIRNNIENIRKYFKTGTWGYFSNDLLKGMGNEIGLIRSLYTDCEFDITSKLKMGFFNNIKKQYNLLTFYKNYNY